MCLCVPAPCGLHGLRHRVTGFEGRSEPTLYPRLRSKLTEGPKDPGKGSFLHARPLPGAFSGTEPLSVEMLFQCCPAFPPSLLGWWWGVMAGSPENSFFSDSRSSRVGSQEMCVCWSPSLLSSLVSISTLALPSSLQFLVQKSWAPACASP